MSTALMLLLQIADGACSSAVNALEAWDDVDIYDVGLWCWRLFPGSFRLFVEVFFPGGSIY